jgi:hypothetical protein
MTPFHPARQSVMHLWITSLVGTFAHSVRRIAQEVPACPAAETRCAAAVTDHDNTASKPFAQIAPPDALPLLPIEDC